MFAAQHYMFISITLYRNQSKESLFRLKGKSWEIKLIKLAIAKESLLKLSPSPGMAENESLAFNL